MIPLIVYAVIVLPLLAALWIISNQRDAARSNADLYRDALGRVDRAELRAVDSITGRGNHR